MNLGNPRAPSTSMPLRRVTQNLAAKHADISQRQPDRGAAVPVLGIVTPYSGAGQGGVPLKPENLWAGLERQPMIKANTGAATAAIATAKKRVNEARAAARPTIIVRPGYSGAEAAKTGPLRVDPRFGVALYRAGLKDVREPSSRGQFSQHRTTPASTLDKLASARIARNAGLYAGVNPKGNLRDTPDETPVPMTGAQIAAINEGAATADLGPQRDQGSALVRPAPENMLTTAMGPGVSDNTLQFGFLAAAAVIGYFILKRMA